MKISLHTKFGLYILSALSFCFVSSVEANGRQIQNVTYSAPEVGKDEYGRARFKPHVHIQFRDGGVITKAVVNDMDPRGYLSQVQALYDARSHAKDLLQGNVPGIVRPKERAASGAVLDVVRLPADAYEKPSAGTSRTGAVLENLSRYVKGGRGID